MTLRVRKSIIYLFCGLLVGITLTTILFQRYGIITQFGRLAVEYTRSSFGGIMSVLTVGFGGLTATGLWWYYRKPEISLGDPATLTSKKPDKYRTTEHHLKIANQGRRAANNAKAKLKLVGELEDEAIRVETILEWVQNGNTITLNAGEHAHIRLLQVHNENRTPDPSDQKNSMIEFISGEHDNSTASIESHERRSDRADFKDIWKDISLEELSNANFEEQHVIVTSAQSHPKKIQIEFGLQKDGELQVDASSDL